MRKLVIALVAVLAGMPAQAKPPAKFTVAGESFVLALPDGKQLDSRQLVGATLNMTTPGGAHLDVRIDSAAPAKERGSLLLLGLSTRDVTTGNWSPLCEKDAYGRSAGFPVAGRWTAHGHYVADSKAWFITCTSGSEGKCVLFGYDPWRKGPHGEDLAPYYEACQHMVRADYDGSGVSHTKDGTLIDIWDHIGIEKDEGFVATADTFEAGWTTSGAVCVGKTRWRDLLTLAALQRSDPALQGPCTEKIATTKGALLFNRSR
jgi:hypothetical protein